MKKLILVSALMILGLAGCTLPNLKSSTLKPEEAKTKALAFINEYLVNPQSPVTLGNINKVSGVYSIEVNLTDGKQVIAYMTTDGKYFFTEGIETAKLAEERKQQAAAQTDAKVETTVITEGQGEGAKSGDLVTVDYKGTLEDGTVFDSSYERGQPVTIPLGQGQVIAGWEQGLIGMKVGEKRKLVIPPALGYGDKGAGTQIPPNATLIFEVEMREIKTQ